MTEENAVVADEAADDATEKRERSTIAFPYGDLNEAISVVAAIHKNVGGGIADVDQVAGWMNQTVTSGAFRTKVNTARIMTLVKTGNAKLQLTALGQKIVSPDTQAQARADAFLAVPLYRAIFEKYKGFSLPPNVGLEREMADLGVAEKQTDRARQAFQRSATQAGFFREGTNKLVRPGSAPTPEAPEREKREEAGGGGGSGGGGDLHPFVDGLVKTLPKPGETWSEDGRQQWLDAASAIFKLIYKDAKPN
jgi:hypothetical protein